MFTHYHDSPLGILEIAADDAAVLEIKFAKAKHKPAAGRAESEKLPGVIEKCVAELDEYFLGKRKDFTFPYRLEGTDFQLVVWYELEKIPFGTTISYGEQADRIGDKKAARAVGMCNGNNPISIVVPCHRVIGADGKLTGYGGDLWRKEWLLNHEAKFSGKPLQLSLF